MRSALLAVTGPGRTGLLAALALAAAALPGTAALAANSNASFSYTAGPPGSATLLLNGGIALTALNRGWFTENGDGNNSQSLDGNGNPLFDGNGNPVLGNNADGNYLVGLCGSSDVCLGDDVVRNNFFVFDLSSFADAISSATLQLAQPDDAYGLPGLDGYNSALPLLTYTNYDVSTDIGTLTAQGTRSVGIYDDLGSGLVYGVQTFGVASNGTTVSIAFNADGLAALNAARGGQFAVGGSINEAESVGAVPEPATWATMMLGFGLVGAAMRRRGARVARA